MDKLTAHVHQNYPDDELLKNWVTYYQQTGRETIEQLIQPPPPVKKQLSNEDYNKKKDKLKSVLQKSYSEERTLTEVVTPQYDTTQQCIETIQNCERLIISGKLSLLHHSAMQGQAIFHLNQNAKKGQNITSLLGENNIKFSTSHCRNLTNLYKLCSEYQNLLKCAVSIRIMLGNIKLVKDICHDLKWQDKVLPALLSDNTVYAVSGVMISITSGRMQFSVHCYSDDTVYAVSGVVVD